MQRNVQYHPEKKFSIMQRLNWCIKGGELDISASAKAGQKSLCWVKNPALYLYLFIYASTGALIMLLPYIPFYVKEKPRNMGGGKGLGDKRVTPTCHISADYHSFG